LNLLKKTLPIGLSFFVFHPLNGKRKDTFLCDLCGSAVNTISHDLASLRIKERTKP
jgi:hypothetical protein